MRYQERLQAELQERYRRLYKTEYMNYAGQARYLRDWVLSQPELASLMRSIETSHPDLDPDKWYQEALQLGAGRGTYELPQTESELAKVAWRIVVRLADGELDGGFARQFSHERNLNDCVRDVTGALVEPLIEYVQRLLARQSDVLYLLERYARRVAWFEQKRLYDAYQADTQRGESIYDADLRGFLFAQGVDYPYSQPAGPSGKADIVAGLEGDDPLACELKLFDGGSYGASYLAKGLGQAIRYAQDYGKTEAQLVIVNLTDQSIELPNDGAVTDWPPRLQLANVTVFLIVVQGKPRPAASAGGRPKPVRLTRDQLIAEEG